MGSQLVVAIVEQRSVGKTNPDGLNPSVSRPITQEEQFLDISSTSLIEQQRVTTAKNSIGNSLSFPIQQVDITRANPPAGVVEQQSVQTSLSRSKPVEQLSFVGSSDLIEQRDIKTSLNTSKPIEQTEEISNTINIEQFDFIDLIFPACGSIRNPVSTNILWRINDTGFPFNISTLIFKVNGLEVQDSSSFSVTGLVNGIQIDYNPPEDLPYDSEIPVYLEVFDTSSTPNRLVISCSFFTTVDSAGPQVINFTLCGQSNVDTKAVVEFDVVDFQTGVNRDSIELSIEGIGICSGLELDPITTVSGDGYHATWEHSDKPFRYGSTVTAAVTAEDLATEPNNTLFVCRFSIEESSPPEFINFDPEPCETFVDNTTGFKFEVYGVEDGVDISTLKVNVDSKRREVLVRPRIRRVE